MERRRPDADLAAMWPEPGTPARRRRRRRRCALLAGTAALWAAGAAAAQRDSGPAPPGSAPSAVADSSGTGDRAAAPQAGSGPPAHDPLDLENRLREALRINADDEAAWRELRALSRGRALPWDSAPYRQTRDALHQRFVESRTEHFVVFSEAGRSATRDLTGRLERTCGEFDRSCGRLGARPLPLRHRLVCVLFRDREAFEDFALRHDGMRVAWSCGYYSLRNDRTVLIDAGGQPGEDEFAPKRAAATAIHEVIHQLHYHSRVQTAHVQYPLWASEGLATAFETDDPARPFGPDRDYGPRRRRFDTLLEQGRLMPLRRLLVLERMPDERPETVFTVYGQSYGLVTWLARTRPRDLGRYLSLMLREPPGRPAARRHLELFEAAFGDIERIERAWLEQEHARLDASGGGGDAALVSAPQEVRP
jgi:hypothetical protein